MKSVPTILAAKRAVDPDLFGRYCLLERITQGGMAEIFRARTFEGDNLDAYLVIKRILPNLAEDEEFISMFVDEARITVQLNHPNICQLYELGQLDGSYFIVMEHIAGQDLLSFQNFIRTNKSVMEPMQAAYIVAKIARGLDYAHRKRADDGTPLGIVHRDISPQNILVSYNGEVKIIDFGIARAKNRRQQTQVGVLKGKFGYMSPEQVTDSKVDGQSDVFATGIMLWELLTNRRLFYSKNSTEILKLVQDEPIRPPSEIVSSVPPELDAIVMKALRRDRTYRYRKGRDLADDLERWLNNQPVSYGERELAQWTCQAFSQSLQLERDKRRLFGRFVTQDDVLEFQREHGVRKKTDDGSERRKLTSDEFDRYKDSVSQRQAIEDVLAEQESDSVRKAVQRSRSRSLPDSGAITSIITTDPQWDDRRRSDTNYLRALLIGALVLALGIGIGIAVSTIGNNEGFVDISVYPSTAAVVFDGRAVEGEDGYVQVTTDDGTYPVVVSMPGYQDYDETVTVEGGQRKSLAVSLDRLPSSEVELRVPAQWENDARVFLNGQEVPITGAVLRYEADPVDSVVIEVDRDGYFVARATLTPTQLADFQLESLPFERVTATVELRSDPSATVSVEGFQPVSVAAEGIVLDDLDPYESHTLELQPSVAGYQALTYTLIFEGAYDRSLTLSLPRIGRTAVDDDEGGRLIIGGPLDQWYSLSVDGRDVGLSTPFDGDAGIAVSSGNRLLTFHRGGDTWTHEISVEEGSTVRVELPIEGMPTQHESGTQK